MTTYSVVFAKFLPLLSPNAMIWSFSLVAPFLNALRQRLQEAVDLEKYLLTNLSTLTTSLS